MLSYLSYLIWGTLCVLLTLCENYGGSGSSYYDGIYYDDGGVSKSFDDFDDTYMYYADFDPSGLVGFSTGSFEVNSSYLAIQTVCAYGSSIVVGGYDKDSGLIVVIDDVNDAAGSAYVVSMNRTYDSGFSTVASNGQHLTIALQGHVYVYAKNSEGRFAPTGTVISRPDLGTFGTAMSVTADFMMFGDYSYDVVYEYRWIEGQLNYNTSIRSTHDSFFGYSIGCTDTLCLIGAPVPGVVSFYTYVDSSWILQSIIESPHIDDNFFGASISISGKIALIGSYLVPMIGIYEFDGIDWIFQNSIRCVSYSVALSGSSAYVVSWKYLTGVSIYDLMTLPEGSMPTRRPTYAPRMRKIASSVNASAFNSLIGNEKVFITTILYFLDLVLVSVLDTDITVNSVVDKPKDRSFREDLLPNARRYSTVIFISYTVSYVSSSNSEASNTYATLVNAIESMGTEFAVQFLTYAQAFGGSSNLFMNETSVSSVIMSVSAFYSSSDDDDDGITGKSSSADKLKIIVGASIGGGVFLALVMGFFWFKGYGRSKKLTAKKVHPVEEVDLFELTRSYSL